MIVWPDGVKWDFWGAAIIGYEQRGDKTVEVTVIQPERKGDDFRVTARVLKADRVNP